MKILIYSYNFLPKNRGGMEKFIFSLVQRLKKNHEISLLLPKRHNICISGIKIYHICEIFPKYNRGNLSRLKLLILGPIKFLSNIISTSIVLPRVLKKNKIQIVNVFQPSIYSTLVNFIGLLFKKRTCISLRGIEGDVNFFSQLSMDSTFLFSRAVIINSKDLFDRYLRTTYIPRVLFLNKKVYYLPNGINVDYWKPDNNDEISKESDLVFVGNLTDKSQIKNKGIKFLYEAIKILRENNNLNLKVLVIGYTNMYLLKKTIAPDIETYFNFYGFSENYNTLKSKIQKSKIFVLPSVSEGMPNSLMEAMALEMPCIASNVGGVPELIENNVDGLIFEPKNPKKFADLIRLLLEDENLQKKLGINARKKMVNKFHWNQIIKKLEILYGKL
jgi:glycosyltransferase involved in cell wall biosynthesis